MSIYELDCFIDVAKGFEKDFREIIDQMSNVGEREKAFMAMTMAELLLRYAAEQTGKTPDWKARMKEIGLDILDREGR